MPLSEREQRLLDDLERQLRAEDPRLATQMAEPPRARVDVRRLVLGVVIALAGLGVVLWGVSSHLLPVGVLGTLLLGVGLLVLTTPGRAARASSAAGGAAASRSPRATARPGRRGDFMARLEQRWDERREREG